MKIYKVFCLFISIILMSQHFGFSYDFPIPGKSADDFSSAYGPRYYNGYDFHEGTDIVAPAYTNVVPILDGIVTQVGDESVIIKHTDEYGDFYVKYLHINRYVEKYDVVTGGSTILGIIKVDHLHIGYLDYTEHILDENNITIDEWNTWAENSVWILDGADYWSDPIIVDKYGSPIEDGQHIYFYLNEDENGKYITFGARAWDDELDIERIEVYMTGYDEYGFYYDEYDLLNNSSNSEYPHIVSYFPDDYNHYGRLNCGDTDNNDHPTSSIGIYPIEFHYWGEYHTVYFRWYINEDTWNSISSYVHIEINVYDTWGNPSTRNNISSPTCIDCNPPEDAPGPLSLISANYIQSSRSIKLEYEQDWDYPSPDYYVIYRCLSSETMTDKDDIGITTNSSEYYDDSNELKPGVAYKYAVAGVNYAGEGLNSNELTVIYGEPLPSTITSSTTLSGAYYCNGTTISDNSTVTINSGTVILIKPNKSIIVNEGSKILAEGTESSPVLFTAGTGTTPGSWGGVYVYGSNNSFRHSTFEYGNWALKLQGPASGNTVERCTFRNNYAGLYIRDNNAEVKSCRIHNNQSYGVYCYNNPEVKFHGNRIYDNLWYGIYSTAGNFLKFGWNVIENNGYGGPSFPLYGICTRDGDYLRFWSGYGDNTLGHNTIRNNYGYEVVADYGSPRVELGVPNVGGQNAIYDEVVSNPYDAYEVWNRAGNPLLWALDCWWGANGPQTYGSVDTRYPIPSRPGWVGSTGPGGAAKMLASEDKDLKERIKELKKVIVESPDSPEAIEAFSDLYGIIRSDLEDELGEKDRFYEYLTELYSKHKSNKLGRFVLRKKIFWKSLQGETEEVIKLSRKALKEFEKAKAEDEDWLSETRMCVLEDLALTYIHIGDIMNGKACLEEVIEKYSFDSTMIALIEEEMEDLENLISEGMMLQKKGVPYWEEEEEDEFIPEEYALAANYPNPFNPITTIPFSLPEESHVKIEIYELSGSCVATLSDKRYQAGNYNVQFNGSGLASGVYFIRTRMVSSEKPGKQHVFTSKMMLLK